MTRLSHAAALAALLAVTAAHGAFAQAQPTQAINEQNEQVTISKSADGAEALRILRTDTKAEVNRYVTKVYRLQNANPFEILPYIRTIAALEKGSVATAINTTEDGKALRWLQVNVPEFQIPYIDAAVTAYDVANFTSTGGDIKFSYRTKYRSAVEVADFIRATTISGDGFIRGDASTNTLYVSDSPSDFRRVLAQIQFYDVPSPQVDVELSLIELTNIDQTSLGLDWDAWKTSLSGKGDVAASWKRDEPAAGGEFTSKVKSFDSLLSLDATTAARFLNYLVDKGKARIHTRTNITVGNGTLAQISTGSQIPEFAYTYAPTPGKSNLTETTPPASDPSEEGITVRVLPVVAMNAARLDVDLFVRDPIGISKTGGTIYSNQRATASLTLKQDQLYKMGGVRRKVETTERKGFPGLKDVPVIKYLFSVETRIHRETELYLFLKPRWTSPVVPDMDAMQSDSSLMAKQVEKLLRDNPNITISPEDAALLQKYFEGGKRDTK